MCIWALRRTGRRDNEKEKVIYPEILLGRTLELVTAACALATKASGTADTNFIVTRIEVQEVVRSGSFRSVGTDTRGSALELNWRMTANEEFVCGEFYMCICAPDELAIRSS
jgi:hypothetical protein